MIDLRAARADPETFRAALARRGAGEAFDELLEADRRWRELVPLVDDLRARQKLDGKPTPEQLEQLRTVKEELKALEERLSAAEAERDAALAKVPNVPDASAADGMREEDAETVREWGEPRHIANARDHLELADYDMERGAKVSGARFGIIVGDAALLSLALYRFALDRLTREGFTAVLPPVLVREDAMYGTGFFPSDKHDYYAVPEDGLYLVGTSEVPLIAMHMGEILDRLPIRYCAFSSCFRREAGAAGKDTRGMFRVHQFQKVEMVSYTAPDASWDEHDRLLEIEESLVREVGLPYRVVNTAAGDLSSAAAKRYDIEAWFPSQERYREITSCSNTTDYQARRSGIRYRVDEKRLETPHTLNGTAVTDRWALAILENFQDEDGSVPVPEPLRAFGAPARLGAVQPGSS
jgi:seryl-tRNA synthetase